MYTCPACGFVQHQATRYCPNCGRRLRIPAPRTGRELPASEPVTYLSGAPVPPDKLPRQDVLPFQAPDRRGHVGQWLGLAGLVAVCVLLVNQMAKAPSCQKANADVAAHHTIIWSAIDTVASVQTVCAPADLSILAGQRHVTVQWDYHGSQYQASYVVTSTDDVQPANQLARQIDQLSSSASLSTLLGLLR